MGVRWLVISISQHDSIVTLTCLKDDKHLTTWRILDDSANRWHRLKILFHLTLGYSDIQMELMILEPGPWSPIIRKTDPSWESMNWERCVQINDVLDKLSLYDQQVEYELLTKEEQVGILPEYSRRRNNEIALPGSIVKCNNIVNVILDDSDKYEQRPYNDHALVISNPEYGGYERILYLFIPVETHLGNRIFARCLIYNMTVVIP